MKISPNGPFTDRSPSRGKEKKGRPTARVRGLGGQLGPTLPSRRLPSPPFGRHPRLPSRRGKVHPHRLYKGVPQERRTTQVTRAPPPLAAHLHILVCRPPLAAALHPLPLPHGLPKGCAGGRSHHRCTPSCCGVSGSVSNAIYFCNLGWNGNFRSHCDRRTCASTRRCRSCGVGVVAPRLAISSLSSTLVRERNPRVWSTRVRLRTSVYHYSITIR
jgi:hypothetical protein